MSGTNIAVPWFLWPFTALWAFLGFILKLVGRIICAVLGLVLMILGCLLTITYVGAWVGIPLATLGLLLLVRAIF